MEGDLLCLPLTWLSPGSPGKSFFWVLMYLCRVGEEELYLSLLCPSLARRLAPLQLCAATVASETAVTAACDSPCWQWVAQRDLTYSLGLGGGTGKLQKGIGVRAWGKERQ